MLPHPQDPLGPSIIFLMETRKLINVCLCKKLDMTYE